MILGKESEMIEFKKSTSELKEGLQSIVAMLNKGGKGFLYFGVNDDGVVVGQNIGKETLRDISNAIRTKVKPECFFSVNQKSDSDGKKFIEIEFSGDRQPYSADGRYYLRFADEDKQMTADELKNLFLNKAYDYSSWEKEDSNTPIEDVDETLLKKEINKGFLNKRIPAEFDDTLSTLKRLGLISKNGKTLNMAGNVLFSSNKPVLVKLAVFATETKETFLKLEHFQGNIYECIENSINFILGSIEWKISLNGNIKRQEVPEIPQTALREIVTNAFCHAKYNTNTTFEICIFSDKLSIYSPGFFPQGYTPEDFALKHEEPVMLNPKIVNLLFKTCEIESFGYGFDNTFKICKKNKIKYEYENTKSGFKFTFYRPLAKKSNNLNKTEQLVFKEIKKDQWVRTEAIAEKIGKSAKTISRAIKKLKDLKYIQRIGGDFDGYWQVLDN